MKKLFAVLLSLVLAASLVMGITTALNRSITPEQTVSLCDLPELPDSY